MRSQIVRRCHRLLLAAMVIGGLPCVGCQILRTPSSSSVSREISWSATPHFPVSPLSSSPSTDSPFRAGLSASFPTASTKDDPKDSVVLIVNHEQIQREDYREELEAFAKTRNASVSDPGIQEAYRAQLINDLLLVDYAKQLEAHKDPTYQILSRQLQRDLLIRHVRETRVFQEAQVTEQEIQQEYQRRLPDLTSPKMAHVRAIQTATRQEADQALEFIRSGQQDFASAAYAFSIHPSRVQGGELPPFPRGTYPEIFEQEAFRLQVGEISNVIETEQGFFILEKTGEILPRSAPLEEVRKEILKDLRAQKESHALQRLLKELREKAKITTQE